MGDDHCLAPAVVRQYMTAHDHVIRTGIQACGVGVTNLNLDLWQTSRLLPGYGYR